MLPTRVISIDSWVSNPHLLLKGLLKLQHIDAPAYNSVGGRSGDMAVTQMQLCCRFNRYAAQALAYSIMRHETCWASTDRAIVQQWQAGSKGRRALVAAVEESLYSPELKEFLEGMDPVHESPEPLNSKGSLVKASRLLFFSVPTYRSRSALPFSAIDRQRAAATPA